MKKIELYTFTYNDEKLLPFFINYYAPIVDRMTFIDSGSTDGTMDLIKDYNIIQTGLMWWDWDKLFYGYKCSVWLNSEYDLILFPDLDEILYHPDLKRFLNETDFDIYQAEGIQMVSRTFPRQGSILQVNRGVPFPLFNKSVIFKPSAEFIMTNAHYIITISKNINRFDIKLLHYKYLGVDYLIERGETILSRIPPDSYTECIGGNILKLYPGFIKSRRQWILETEQLMKQSKPVC